MKAALLDFPWTLDQLLDSYTAASKAILDFDTLVRKHHLTPVPFIDSEAQARFYARINELQGGKARYGYIRRFLDNCSGGFNLGMHSAEPSPLPDSLTHHWKRALRGAFDDADWRVPQIVVPATRKGAWASTAGEIAISLEDRPTEGARRIVADLTSYDEHPFVFADFDPWDLRRHHPPPGPPHLNHPCRLPRPHNCGGDDIKELCEHLITARQGGWKVGTKNYYIPPAAWDPLTVTKSDWRAGKTFPRATIDRHSGYLDHWGNVWEWDGAERHWDVQLLGGGYQRVNHLGDSLD